MAGLDTPLEEVVGDRTAKPLEKSLGLRTVGDLLRHYPRRYAERGELDDALAVIAELASRPRVRAVGETGLDFYRTEAGPRRDAQFASFEAHIDIAKRHGLALQIHDRDAHVAVVDTLLRVGAPDRTVFHCFSGDAGLARLATSHGWYLSFAGTVTFKNAEDLRAALRIAHRAYVVETGHVTLHGEAAELAKDARVVDAYLGA